MTLLQTILEVFHRSIIRIGQQMCLKILDVCGVIFDPKPHTFSQQFVFTKKFLLFKKLLVILNVMILLTFEHLYIITAWFLIDFSETNDNGNVLLEIF